MHVVEKLVAQLVNHDKRVLRSPVLGENGSRCGKGVNGLEKSIQAGPAPISHAHMRTMPPVVEPMVCGRQMAAPWSGFL